MMMMMMMMMNLYGCDRLLVHIFHLRVTRSEYTTWSLLQWSCTLSST